MKRVRGLVSTPLVVTGAAVAAGVLLVGAAPALARSSPAADAIADSQRVRHHHSSSRPPDIDPPRSSSTTTAPPAAPPTTTHPTTTPPTTAPPVASPPSIVAPPPSTVAPVPPVLTPPATTPPVTSPGTAPGSQVLVSNTAELSAALAAATPGTTIVMAPGAYPGRFTASRSGAPGAPITLTGPSNAVIDGGPTKSGYSLHLSGASWWDLSGFSVVHGQKGIVLDASSHDVLQGLNVSQTGDEAVHFRQGSSDDTIQNSIVHDTGLHAPIYGEGIYFGSANHNWVGGRPDLSNNDRAVGNTIFNTTAENIDAKEGTSGGVITGNHLDGAGSSAADGWIDVKGNGYDVEGNVGVHAAAGAGAAGAETFVLFSGFGNDNVFRSNNWDFAPGNARYGFEINGGTGNVVSCSNVVTAAASLSNLTCSP